MPSPNVSPVVCAKPQFVNDSHAILTMPVIRAGASICTNPTWKSMVCLWRSHVSCGYFLSKHNWNKIHGKWCGFNAPPYSHRLTRRIPSTTNCEIIPHSSQYYGCICLFSITSLNLAYELNSQLGVQRPNPSERIGLGTGNCSRL